MGENCRHRSRGSGSPTRHEAPPIPRHRRQQAPLRLLPSGERDPRTRFTVRSSDPDPRRKHANAELPLRSPPAPGAAATPAARRPGGCPGVQGRGAQTVAPQVRPTVSPPRAGPCNRDPDAPAGRRLPRHPAWLAGGRREIRNRDGGGGRCGGGAPIPVTFAGLELHAPLSVLAGGEEFLPGTLSPQKQFLGGSRSPRDLGGSCLSPSACFGGGRRSSSAARTPRRASRGVRLPGGTRSGSGRRTGPRGTPPAAPTGRRVHSVLDARANNTERRCRRPPPAPSPRAPLHNRARGPAPEAGGAAGLSPPNLPPFPPGAIPRQSASSNFRFSLSSSAPRTEVQPWRETQPPPPRP